MTPFHFSAITSYTSDIYKVLKSIAPKKHGHSKDSNGDLAINSTSTTFVRITLTPQGLACSIGKMQSGLHRVYLDKDLFSSFKVEGLEDGELSFKLSLDRLITCLRMFEGEGETCRFVYEGPGHPFMMMFKSQHSTTLVTTCEFKTLDLDDDDDDEIELDLENVVLQVILPGKVMSEVFTELRSVGTRMLTICASSSDTKFALISHGNLGITQFSFPEEKNIIKVFIFSPELLEDSGSTPEDSVANSYHYSTVLKAYEAIALSTEVSLRCDSRGCLCLQAKYGTNEGRLIYFDFRCSALIEEEYVQIINNLSF